MEWQPIETAPKDGTVVLLVDTHGAVYVGWYNKHTSHGCSYEWVFVDDTDFHAAKHDLTEFIRPNAWDEHHAPRLWMPLPAPPSNKD